MFGRMVLLHREILLCHTLVWGNPRQEKQLPALQEPCRAKSAAQVRYSGSLFHRFAPEAL